MKGNFITIFIILGVVFVSACTSQSQQNNLNEFEDLCTINGHMWMEMEEMRDGEFIGGGICSGCMPSDNMDHFCSMGDYKNYMDESGGHVMSHDAMTAHAGNKDSVDIHMYKVGFTRPEVQSGKETLLTFAINEISSGKPVSDLEIVHEKIMHVVLVRDDLKYFDHVHPEMKEPGKLTVPYTFSASGTYRIWIDFTIDGMQHIVDFDINVPGEIELEEKDMLNRLEVEFIKPEKLESGEEIELKFTVTDSSNNAVPITEKFLGAAAHMIDIDETLNEFNHNHDENFDGNNIISFLYRFNKSGNHRLWIQFIANSKETTASFDVIVK